MTRQRAENRCLRQALLGRSSEKDDGQTNPQTNPLHLLNRFRDDVAGDLSLLPQVVGDRLLVPFRADLANALERPRPDRVCLRVVLVQVQCLVAQTDGGRVGSPNQTDLGLRCDNVGIIGPYPPQPGRHLLRQIGDDLTTIK